MLQIAGHGSLTLQITVHFPFSMLTNHTHSWHMLMRLDCAWSIDLNAGKGHQVMKCACAYSYSSEWTVSMLDQRRLRMCHHTSHVCSRKLHSCIIIISESKQACF